MGRCFVPSTSYSLFFMLEQAHPPFARLETPKAHPASKTFTPIFNTVGGATWDAFDTFLAESSGMTFSCLLND